MSTGYLTNKDYNDRRNSFILGYPSQEVGAALLNFLLPYYSKVSAAERSITGWAVEAQG